MLSIQTFGALRVCYKGEDMPLPTSRKTRALLGFLAISGSPQRRDRLCEIFWDVPDDPRGALRWSLSKLRSVVNIGEVIRLLADRERVQLDNSLIEVDFQAVADAARDENAIASDLEDAWQTASKLLLEDCELPNQTSFAAWLEQHRNEAVRFRLKIARSLATRPGLDPEVSERWAERWLADAPFDATAAQFAVQSRRRLGREHEATALAKQLEQTFHDADLPLPDWNSPQPHIEPEHLVPVITTDDSLAPRQSVRFVTAKDGTSLAWATVGTSNNPPLVKAANWLSHLELDWEAPIWSPLFRNLATTFQLIRYDERGCGLSDWDVPELSQDTFVSDLETVVDAAGLDTFPLLGISQGAAVSVEYAARHPERVSKLILFGGYSAGWRHTAKPEEFREREAVMVLTETGWGRTNPAYRHMFSQTFMPEATLEELAWFDEFQRNTTSPRNAVRFLDAFANIDIRHRLKDVQAPTLVIHCRDDLRIPLSSGRDIAAQIPNAEFVTLDSPNHLLLGREPASQKFVECVRRFLAE